MIVKAAVRLMAALPTRPNKPTPTRWLDKAEEEQKGKSRNRANDLPEGLFEGSPGQIANTLKMKSDGFKQAISRLNFYRNRSGDNLTPEDEKRLDQAKEALYRAYGRELPT